MTSPQITPEFLGLVALSLVLFSKWLWDYKRDARAEAERTEPRANPPLHLAYATKAEHAELKSRVDRIADEIVRGFERVDQKRSVSVAGLHDDLERSITALRDEMREDISGVHERVNVVLAGVARLEGKFDR